MSDFFLPVIVSARIDNPTISAYQQVLIRAQQTLSWLPNLTGEASSMFFGSPPKFPRLNREPAGLTEAQQRQWVMVWDAMQPLTSNVLRGELQLAKIEGDKLASNTAFWDTVYRVDLGIATVGASEVLPAVKEKWSELQAKTKEWQKIRQWALDIAAHPDCPPAKAEQVRARIAELDSSIGAKIASLTAQLPGFKDGVQQEGLGALPAIIGSIATVKGAVLITAIIAVLALLVYCISSVKTIVNDLGLAAVGDAVKAGQKLLGPWLGVAIFAGIGFIIYRKMTQPKTVLRIGR